MEQRYNLFPDEKGTESRDPTPLLSDEGLVTTYSPMKRGLKALQPLPVPSSASLDTQLQPIPR